MLAGAVVNPLSIVFLTPIFKISILMFLVFYAIFALLVVKQVDLMSKTVITLASPIIRAISILHAGIALALIILEFGTL